MNGLHAIAGRGNVRRASPTLPQRLAQWIERRVRALRMWLVVRNELAVQRDEEIRRSAAASWDARDHKPRPIEVRPKRPSW
jgi:hypothetical protein